MKTPTLLDVNLSAESRVVTATLAPGCTPKPGDAYLVQTNGSGDLVVLDGHRQIARITNPPASITEALGACRGMRLQSSSASVASAIPAELKLG